MVRSPTCGDADGVSSFGIGPYRAYPKRRFGYGQVRDGQWCSRDYVPFVGSAEEARRAVQFMKYPPQGTRGVAGIIRATNYGSDWNEYFHQANRQSLVVVQIETPQAVDAAESIAAVEGVDVLFVGPLDLSVNLGCPGDFSPPHFVDHLRRVVEACRKHGKTPGILSRPNLVAQHRELGFRFFALGSDTGRSWLECNKHWPPCDSGELGKTL